MSRDNLEREIHDYLDGRLSAVERVAFEQRLTTDPSLARRLASYGEVRRALREATIEPPPGFYARARARFEERRRTAFPLHRPLSWEVVGLGVAALLVIAILLPKAWEDRRADRPTTTTPAPEKSEPLAARPEPPLLEAESNREVLGRLQETAAPGDKEAEVVYDAAESRGNEAGDLAAQKPAVEPEPRPEVKESAAHAKDDDGADAQVLGSPGNVGGAKTESGRLPEAAPGRRADGAAPEPRVEEPSAARERDFAPVPDALKKAPTDDASWGTPLPEGFFVPPSAPVADEAPAKQARQRADVGREVIVIDDPDTWDRMGGSLLLDDVESGLSSHRLVLIAPRPEPIDCKALRWHREGQEIVIELAPAPVSVPSPTGCGLWIPAGSEPVTFRAEQRP